MKRWRSLPDGARIKIFAKPCIAWLSGALAAALAAFSSGTALAQVTASATLETQYDLRGLSLDDGQPDLRIGLGYDHPSGAYGGLSGLAGETARDGVRPLGYVGYLGFARQTRSGVTWDIGVTDTAVTLYLPARAPPRPETYANYADHARPSTHHYRADYAEAYGGLSLRDFSARLYLSPDYLNQGVRTAYLDLTQGFHPTGWLRLYVHAGALSPLAATSPRPGAGRERFDAGAGAVWILPRAELRLGWTGVTPPQNYPYPYKQKPSRLTVGVTGFF